MPLTSLLHQDIVVLAATPKVSRAGDPSADWSKPVEVATIKGWIQQRRSGENETLRSQESQRGRLYAFPEAPLRSGLRVRCNGQVWQIVGPPRMIYRPGHEHHVQVDVEFVDG